MMQHCNIFVCSLFYIFLNYIWIMLAKYCKRKICHWQWDSIGNATHACNLNICTSQIFVHKWIMIGCHNIGIKPSPYQFIHILGVTGLSFNNPLIHWSTTKQSKQWRQAMPTRHGLFVIYSRMFCVYATSIVWLMWTYDNNNNDDNKDNSIYLWIAFSMCEYAQKRFG